MKALAVLVVLATAAATSAAESEALRQAKQHYDRGMDHYELGEFAAAVEEFKAAYALSRAPGLLFNLAQASRLGKAYEAALHFYRSYLRERPDAPNRDDVEQRIRELEPIVAAAAARPQSTVPSRPPTARATPARAVAWSPTAAPSSTVVKAPRGGKKERVAGIVVGTLGLGALGAGVGFGVAALDAQNKLSRVASGMGSWTADEAALYRSGQRDANVATAMYVVGGVAVATGVVLYAVGWKRDRARFAVAPAPGGAEVAWSCAF